MLVGCGGWRGDAGRGGGEDVVRVGCLWSKETAMNMSDRDKVFVYVCVRVFVM